MHGSKRDSLLEIYQAALHAVNGRVAVAERLTRTPLEGAVRMVAVGKAAQSMAEGAWDRLNRRITQGLIISKPGHLDLFRCVERGWEAIEGGHPLPDGGSLSAGNRLLEFLSEDDPTPLLFLISGGASSLLECPVDGVDQGLLVRAHDWLLGSGLAIDQMNLVRKGMSRIKGGGLLRWMSGRQIRALAISDVPGDDPATIGSGLLVPAPGLQAGLERLSLPAWLEGPLQRGLDQRDEMPRQGPEIELVANLGLAKQAAAERASAMGFPVRATADFIAGDAAEEGRRLVSELLRGGPGVTIWGGETTVRLPDASGRGGRNQQLALAAAQGLAGNAGVWLLAVGTDGTDGPTEDAGALVDGATLQRAETEGMDVARSLSRADAGSLLEATGDLITTGPTGTNVMDLMIGLKL